MHQVSAKCLLLSLRVDEGIERRLQEAGGILQLVEPHHDGGRPVIGCRIQVVAGVQLQRNFARRLLGFRQVGRLEADSLQRAAGCARQQRAADRAACQRRDANGRSQARAHPGALARGVAGRGLNCRLAVRPPTEFNVSHDRSKNYLIQQTETYPTKR
ncbi:protein of unknown function (plasmid) [Cupriavidus taiwanensis]|uniref:Uncharacterized protein n=1 Tax=Cupriavidus taiwanensis TaxID=164546 RepID=A0A9Q7UXX2_9BURK|nr:protein of unknown function [Cupriavidus taiwanensis]